MSGFAHGWMEDRTPEFGSVYPDPNSWVEKSNPVRVSLLNRLTTTRTCIGGPLCLEIFC